MSSYGVQDSETDIVVQRKWYDGYWTTELPRLGSSAPFSLRLANK